MEPIMLYHCAAELSDLTLKHVKSAENTDKQTHVFMT